MFPLRKPIIVLLILILILSCFQVGFAASTKKKTPTLDQVLEYTAEDLEKLFIPTSGSYDPLPDKEPVYFIENIAQELKYDVEPIGLVPLKYSIGITPYDNGVRASYTDFYLLLKDFAKSKGGNVVRLTEEQKSMPPGLSFSYDITTTFEIGRRVEKETASK